MARQEVLIDKVNGFRIWRSGAGYSHETPSDMRAEVDTKEEAVGAIYRYDGWNKNPKERLRQAKIGLLLLTMESGIRVQVDWEKLDQRERVDRLELADQYLYAYCDLLWDGERWISRRDWAAGYSHPVFLPSRDALKMILVLMGDGNE
jgi:hypothetical protein